MFKTKKKKKLKTKVCKRTCAVILSILGTQINDLINSIIEFELLKHYEGAFL